MILHKAHRAPDALQDCAGTLPCACPIMALDGHVQVPGASSIWLYISSEVSAQPWSVTLPGLAVLPLNSWIIRGDKSQLREPCTRVPLPGLGG